MKIGVLIGQKFDGTFEPLALPDRDVVEQRAMFKNILRESAAGKAKYQRVSFYDQPTKTARFRVKVKPDQAEADKKGKNK